MIPFVDSGKRLRSRQEAKDDFCHNFDRCVNGRQLLIEKFMGTIRKQTIDLLKSMGWRFSVNEDGCIFLGTKSDFTWSILFLQADEDNRRLVNVAYLPLQLPQDQVLSVLGEINKIHIGSVNAAYLILDEEVRCLGARAVMDIPAEGIHPKLFDYFLRSTCGLLDNSFRRIMLAAFGAEENIPNIIGMEQEGTLFFCPRCKKLFLVPYNEYDGMIYSEQIPCKHCGNIRTLPSSDLSLCSTYRQIWKSMEEERNNKNDNNENR